MSLGDCDRWKDKSVNALRFVGGDKPLPYNELYVVLVGAGFIPAHISAGFVFESIPTQLRDGDLWKDKSVSANRLAGGDKPLPYNE